MSTNDFDIDDIIKKISTLDKKSHVIIGSIFQKYPTIKLNENKSGIMINSNTVTIDAWKEINEYLKYINTQNQILNKIENEAEEYKKYVS
jgi:hypothetical protein